MVKERKSFADVGWGSTSATHQQCDLPDLYLWTETYDASRSVVLGLGDSVQRALKIIPARYWGFKKKTRRLFMFSSYNEILFIEGIGLCPCGITAPQLLFFFARYKIICHLFAIYIYVYPQMSSNRHCRCCSLETRQSRCSIKWSHCF